MKNVSTQNIKNLKKYEIEQSVLFNKKIVSDEYAKVYLCLPV
jgi:hypothetical protein